MSNEILNEFFKFLPQEERDDLKAFSNLYNIELTKTQDELIDILYKLKDNLHPQFLYTMGRQGTSNSIDWLIENKKMLKENNKNSYAQFRYRLQELSDCFAGRLFGEFVDEPFDNELVYQIASSTFKKIGIHSYVQTDKDDDLLRLYLDMTPFGHGFQAYKFVPWISGIDKELGKPLREYYLENELRVEMGLKPTVFRSISTGVTTPAHEIIHYMSSIHNNDAYTSSVIQSFNQSFKEMPNVFSLTQDRGILFGVIDSKFRDKINSKGFDIRGKDLNDPFIFWEIIKKHGVEIADATDVPLNKLYDASFNYLSKYIPFRLLEEGVASYLSINNASIDRTPKELSGLDKSLKSLVNLGSKLRKLEYFERAIDFYTGNKQLADYYIPELQLYPLSYLYVAYQVDNQKPNNAKWYFDLLRQNYQKRNLSMPSFPRHVERKTREEAYPHLAQQQRIQALIEQTNQNIQNYTRRLDEIDRLLSEYRNQLNQLQEHSSSSPGFDYNYSDLGQISSYEPRRTRPTTELDRLLNNHRVRSSVRRYINNNEVLSTLSVVALGAVAGYTISRVLRGLFDR